MKGKVALPQRGREQLRLRERRDRRKGIIEPREERKFREIAINSNSNTHRCQRILLKGQIHWASTRKGHNCLSRSAKETWGRGTKIRGSLEGRGKKKKENELHYLTKARRRKAHYLHRRGDFI